MKRTGIALSTVALLMLLGGAVGSVSAATPGFAAYKVQFASRGTSYSLIVNETVAATSNSSYDNLILSLTTGTWNSSYSRSINSSSDVSPFLPSITNQSFSYASASGNFTAGISKNGTLPLQFQGKSYTLTIYLLTAKAVYNGSTTALQGEVSAFPSGLVYSVSINMNYPSFSGLGLQGMLGGINPSPFSIPNGLSAALTDQNTANVTLTLISTSLPLNAGSASTTAQVASIGIGAGAAVTALAVGLGVRHRGKQKEVVPEQKPEHWVD
jgi:hypothetical protein